MNSPSNDPAANEAAALWAAKLDGGSLAESERPALEAWLAAAPGHRALLSQYCQFSADLEQQLPALVLSGAITVPQARRRTATIGRWLWAGTAIAAAAAIAIAIWPRTPGVSTQSAATSVAQRQTLELGDGTVVELNARTSLLVDLGSKERHVRIADGEAFFTVAKDASRPFIVETPAGAIRVTGTVFNVLAESADLTVTVVEGSVLVTPAIGSGTGAPVALGANDQLVASTGAATQLSASDLDDVLAWRRGEVVFDSVPLDAALARFARYHGRAIHAASDVGRLRVGGRYNLDNLESFLSDIQSFLPVQVARDQSSGAITVTARAGH